MVLVGGISLGLAREILEKYYEIGVTFYAFLYSPAQHDTLFNFHLNNVFKNSQHGLGKKTAHVDCHSCFSCSHNRQ